MFRAVVLLRAALQRRFLGVDTRDIRGKPGQQEFAGKIGDRPTAVGGTDVEDFLHRRRKAANHQLRVEKHGCDLGALEQVLQIVVGVIERLHLADKLGVDGVQLLVDGLQFLFRSLQLLVGGLHFFVDRDQLLVGGFQLLQRGLIFLEHRLQAFARLAQFAFDMGSRPVGGQRMGLTASSLCQSRHSLIHEQDEVKRIR